MVPLGKNTAPLSDNPSFVIVLSVVVSFLYSNTIVRYVLIGLLLIAAILGRKKIKSVVRSIRK